MYKIFQTFFSLPSGASTDNSRSEFVRRALLNYIVCLHSEKIKQREFDPDEQIRQEVVKTICEAAAESITCLPDMVSHTVV